MPDDQFDSSEFVIIRAHQKADRAVIKVLQKQMIAIEARMALRETEDERRIEENRRDREEINRIRLELAKLVGDQP